MLGFQIKVGWESCGRDGCGEEDGGSRVRRWRHLKARGHQRLWNGKSTFDGVTLEQGVHFLMV